MEKKKRSILTIIAGSLVVMLGIFFQVMTDYSTQIILTFINAGTIMIILGAISYQKKGVGHDERTKKISAKALSLSWFITFIALNLLFWIDELQVFQLTAKQVLSILMPLMLLTGAGLQAYMRKKA